MEGGAVRHNIGRGTPKDISAKFALIWFSGFRGEDLNVIFHQNMSNLPNQYKSVERQNSQKNPDYMLIYSLKGNFAKKFIFYMFFLMYKYGCLYVY